jgi:hypothetical protein
LFFDKTGPTKEIWYYDLPLPSGLKNFSKSKPIRANNFLECSKLWDGKTLSDNSWVISAEQVVESEYNLNFKNPNKKNGLELEKPQNLLHLLSESNQSLNEILTDLKNELEFKIKKYRKETLGDWLTKYRNIVRIEDDLSYKQVTISQNGDVSYRGEKLGSQIGRKRQFAIDLNKHPRTLIFIRQGVQNGGIGLVPSELDGCIVTENMPMFEIRGDMNDKFLSYYLKSPLFKKEVEKVVPKGTAQKAIHEDKLLKIPVYFIDLAEQEKFVRMIEKFENLSNTVEKMKKTAEPLIESFYHNKFNDQ